jgi:hypothetical protein
MAVKFYRYALVGARARPIAFTAALAAIVALAIAAVCGILYVASPVPPYGFYYDLGVDLFATSAIAHWLQSWADVKDAFGWAGWGNRSAFAFNPMTSIAISAIVAKVFGGNPFAAVKTVQVIEVFLAAASAFYLYRVLRGSSPWAWVAAVVYAFLTQQLLMVRGDLAFGFTAVLAPLEIAVPLALVRRYGLAALPICGALVALFSAYFTIEHLFLEGIPAYAFAAVLALDRRRLWAWFVALASGLVILFASIAYVVLPTQASTSLFSPSATVGAALASGEFAQYQNGPLALASLSMNEFIVNQRKEFAVGPLLFLTIPVGLVLWALAVAWIAGAVRRKALAWGEGALSLLALICILLSTGALIPGGGIVWWMISQLPVISDIRTPDRFITLGVVVIVIFAISQLEWLSSRVRSAYYAAALGALLCACGLTTFFLLRVFSGDPYTLEDKEPHLDTVATVAQARDNRVANLALTDNGSVFDTTMYGAPVPVLDFQGDFADRYEGDGLGGAGLLARGNVATIVATPPWTPDSPLLGQSSLVRAAFLRPLAGDAMTVTAYGVNPVRGFVRGVTGACMFGGPGLLDNALALPDLSRFASTIGAVPCARNIYMDSAPLGIELGGTPVYRWTAITLFPRSGVMRDVDYRLTFGRFLINFPWYRNSVDGDAPVFGEAALSLDAGNEASSVFEIDHAGTYSFVLHIVCHGEARGRVLIDRRERSFVCKPFSGFQWLKLPIGHLTPGLHSMMLVFDTVGEPTGALSTTWRLAFDGAAVVRRTKAIASSTQSAFIFSARRLQTRAHPPLPKDALMLVRLDGMQLAPPARSNDAQRLLARAANAVATYRWDGPPGAYRVWATAYAESGDEASSFVGVYSGSRCCAGVATTAANRGALLIAQGGIALHRGDLVHVLLHGASNDNLSIAEILGVAVDPDPFPAVLGGDHSSVSADFDFLERFRNLAPELPEFSASSETDHSRVTRFAGLPVSSEMTLPVAFPSNTSSSPTTLSISGEFGGGPVHVRLDCGGSRVEASFVAPENTLALPPTNERACVVTLSSLWSTAYVQDVAVSRSVESIDVYGRRWLGAGRYHVIRARRGLASAGGTLLIDGHVAGDSTRVPRDGWYTLTWNGAPSDAYLLGFVPAAWREFSSNVGVRQTASARWMVTVARTTTLEAAVFPDGYWRLQGAARAPVGHRCDLENTCFDNVARGTYVLLHVWPAYIKLGFLVTLVAWLIAIATYVRARLLRAAAPS